MGCLVILVTNEFMSCGIFLSFSAECNNGMVCKNGGMLDLKTCKCTCQYGWTGDLCGKNFLLLLEFYSQSVFTMFGSISIILMADEPVEWQCISYGSLQDDTFEVAANS